MVWRSSPNSLRKNAIRLTFLLAKQRIITEQPGGFCLAAIQRLFSGYLASTWRPRVAE